MTKHSMLIIANWKSNFTRDQAEKWLSEFANQLKVPTALEKLISASIVIAPAFPHVQMVSDELVNNKILKSVSVGVQDISPFPAGSYTGAVSGQNLEGYHVKYAILGHSERRKYFHETNIEVAKKVEQCFDHDITPVICVDRGEIQNQADELDKDIFSKLVIAYEPVEHIGTGEGEDATQVAEVIAELADTYPEAKLIYGGSVNRGNVADYTGIENLQGFLVGTASLKAEEFVDVVTMSAQKGSDD